MSSLRQTFANNLRKYRQLRELSQEAVAEIVGGDRTSISRIERVAPNLALDKVILLAKALDVSAAQMLAEDPAARRTDPPPRFKEVRRIGDAVRACRLESGLSQRELGDLAGLDRNHISRVETDTTNLALDTLEKITDALGVSVDRLVQ